MSHPPTPPIEEAPERWDYVQKPERELQQVIAPAIREAMEAREPDEIICQIEADQNLTREQTDFLIDIRRVSLAMLCWEEYLRKAPLFRGSQKFPQDSDPTQRVRKWARAKVARFLGDSIPLTMLPYMFLLSHHIPKAQKQKPAVKTPLGRP